MYIIGVGFIHRPAYDTPLKTQRLHMSQYGVDRRQGRQRTERRLSCDYFLTRQYLPMRLRLTLSDVKYFPLGHSLRQSNVT